MQHTKTKLRVKGNPTRRQYVEGAYRSAKRFVESGGELFLSINLISDGEIYSYKFRPSAPGEKVNAEQAWDKCIEQNPSVVDPDETTVVITPAVLNDPDTQAHQAPLLLVYCGQNPRIMKMGVINRYPDGTVKVNTIKED